MQTGLVFNIQKYSVHDGPGIRTTVFLKGCPLCCVWCHNPEGMVAKREFIVVESRCAQCGACREVCPFAESLPGKGPLPVQNPFCTQCEACLQACPTEARQMAGREMSVAQVMDEILQDRVFYEESGGGVTFSGGEPLMQPGFVEELMTACRVRGLHTALDTCGFGCTDHLLTLGRLASLVLYDLKLMEEARHQQYCGVPNKGILENLRALDGLGRPIWIRVPVVPGVNDDDANFEAMARFASTLRHVQRVNLLPYHGTGVQKFRRLGLEPPLEALAPPGHDDLQGAVRAFQAFGLQAVIGG